MVTLKDVAKHAAVSTSTASRILHGGKIQVTTVTRNRVVRAAEELNYRANALARGLRTRTTNTLGFLVPDIQNPFYTQLVAGAQEAAQENGYTLVILAARSPEERIAALSMMTEDRVDGVLVGEASVDEKWIGQWVNRSVPFVLVNQSGTDTTVPSVLLDDEAGARMAARYLLDCGHREIAYLAAPQENEVGRTRRAGAISEFELEGVTLTETRNYECGLSGEGAAAAVDRLLWHGETITAVATGGIVIAMLALKALLQRGVRVPEDVSIIGLHDTPFAQYMSPGLTTVRMPIEEMGRRAVLSVLTQAEGEPGTCTVIRSPKPVLVVRDSVSEPRGSR